MRTPMEPCWYDADAPEPECEWREEEPLWLIPTVMIAGALFVGGLVGWVVRGLVR